MCEESENSKLEAHASWKVKVSMYWFTVHRKCDIPTTAISHNCTCISHKQTPTHCTDTPKVCQFEDIFGSVSASVCACLSAYILVHGLGCACVFGRACVYVCVWKGNPLQRNPPLTDVAVAGGKSPRDVDVGTPHKAHGLSEHDAAFFKVA